ncbi:hypothetical protein E1A91_A13G218800v1 [Gossypium mustelinum]|uniref:Glutaredoxin domain-containing protein n=1 Tax=Gossypium mustelinum TaxID=34275 RepID=A0A5D2WKR5_GOSMU|nr:hypothetical protein E1A91_A13G218800v1 [Gossypium mustelinum]
MQSLRSCSTNIPPSFSSSSIPMMTTTAALTSAALSFDEEESMEARIRRLISEHPVIIFSRSSCCMCHVMKKLLVTIGVHPTVIQLDDHEIASLPLPPLPPPPTTGHGGISSRNPVPAMFIGGSCVGGLESLVALHLSGHLIPKLIEVGAL